MSLLHPAILYGLGLAAIPLILHFLLRQKPKKLLFPALRLIQNRRKQNVRRMRLRQLLLMLLRMLLIAAVVFALSRPSVPAADYSLNLREVLTLLGIGLAALVAYYGVSARWRNSTIPRHELKSRRQQLRGASLLGALALALLLVGWPYQRRIAAEFESPAPAGGLSLPVAAVFLFDTSLSMGYQQEGKTRLDVAREVALAHLSDLPVGSRVAIADIGHDHPVVFQSTLAGAELQLKSRTLQSISLPLNDRIRAAVRLQDDDRRRTLGEQASLPENERKDRFLRRIYVFTDLARSAWRAGASSRIQAELERLKTVNLFIVDVGMADPVNTAIIDVEPAQPRIVLGADEFVRATISGGKEGQNLELWLDDGTGRLIKSAQRPVPPGDDSAQSVEFGPLPIKSGPIIHGEVRLVASDPLPVDDIRYFTIQSRDPIPVLTVATDPEDAEEWNTALDVQGYRTHTISVEELSEADLNQFDAVCLINVPTLDRDAWLQLADFVQGGGSLAIFLGSGDLEFAVNYATDEAQALLPGAPQAHSSPGVIRLQFADSQHPLIRNLDKDDSVAQLEAVDILRFWRVVPAEDASVIARYGDEERSPALLEKSHGRGRVMMLTTAVDRKGYRSNWNELASLSGSTWAYLALADEMIRYLIQDSDVQLTYNAGEQPVIRMRPQDVERQFLLQQPEFRQSRVTLPAGQAQLMISDASELGAYNLKQPSEPPVIVSGFSVNPPPGESDFTRATADELDGMLGKGRYQVVRSIGELQEEINTAELGQELFPWVLAIVIFVFCAEHFMANWFYDEEPGTRMAPATWDRPLREMPPPARVTAT